MFCAQKNLAVMAVDLISTLKKKRRKKNHHC